jgi:hypothetical protein
MNFKGKAKRIDDIDLPLIGRMIGVGEDEVHAILDAESAGSGFDKQGRPKMLFEPHIYWRELGPGPKRDKAAAQGLAYPRWKRNYPDDSYPRLAKALDIDEETALRSASWGLPQMMGFNCKLAGYPTAKAMVTDFLDDEDTHLRAMIRFITATGLDDELRRHDWKGFARGYNGEGFAQNGYDKKLAAAFSRWQKIKDTPIPATPHVRETPKTEHEPPVMSKSAPVSDIVRQRTDQNPIKKSPPKVPAPAKDAGKALAGGAAGALAVLVAYAGDAWAKFVAFADYVTFWN